MATEAQLYSLRRTERPLWALSHALGTVSAVTAAPLLPLALRLGLTGAFDASAIARLIDNGVEEDDRLDFKKGMYASNDAGRNELAKDVAAFANHRGGVIVIGVDEAGGRATSLHPLAVADPDALKRQIVGTLASRIRPMVAGVHVAWVPADDTTGYLLVGVPASPTAPHAAGDQNQPGIHFPVRDGSQTRYMSELELSGQYQRRFAGTARIADRLEAISSNPLDRMDRAKPWLYVSLVPDAPGDKPITTGAHAEIRQWWIEHAPRTVWNAALLDSPDVEIGRRLLTVGMWLPPSRTAMYHLSDLHSDGSSFNAHQVGQQDDWPTIGPDSALAQFMAIPSSVGMIAVLLRLAVVHAVEQAGAAGTARVRAGVLISEPALPLLAGYYTPSRSVARGSRPVMSSISVEAGVSLETIIEDTAVWMQTTKRIMDEVVNEFGVEEITQITSAGEIRSDRWGDKDVVGFAARHGIATA